MSFKPISSSDDDEKITDDSFEESGWTKSLPVIISVRRLSGLPVDNKSFKYNLSFKKRRSRGALLDDSLEDTASSPVHSPKVNDGMMISQYRTSTKQRDKMGVSQDRRSASSHIDMRSDLGFILRESDDTELKNRGLCLVPLSMVVNYLG
ncbi:hypothetical protein OIU76_025648 [Salix suchowensis]|nr:hypothetical protein OIU76_025648 [Salix suchowensis]